MPNERILICQGHPSVSFMTYYGKLSRVFQRSVGATCRARLARAPPKAWMVLVPCKHLAAVWDAFRNEVLLPRFQANALP